MYHNHPRDNKALDTGGLITGTLPSLVLLQGLREQPNNQPRNEHYKYEHNVHVFHHVMLAL